MCESVEVQQIFFFKFVLEVLILQKSLINFS